MPPHCDTKDGPVAKAAQRALVTGDVKIILPYVYKAGEREVEELFVRTLAAMKKCGEVKEAKELVEEWFLENVVRIHRAGENAPYTGLKPAGLSEGPVIPVAEAAIKSEDPSELVAKLTEIVAGEIKKRFEKMLRLKKTADKSVDEGREYVEAMLGLQVWSHKLYTAAVSDPHGKKTAPGCGHHEETHKH